MRFCFVRGPLTQVEGVELVFASVVSGYRHLAANQRYNSSSNLPRGFYELRCYLIRLPY